MTAMPILISSSMKTAEEILLDNLLSDEQKEAGDHEYYKQVNRHEFPKWVKSAQDFAAQEVSREIGEYKERIFKNMKKLVAQSQPSDWEQGWNSALQATIAVIKQTN